MTTTEVHHHHHHHHYGKDDETYGEDIDSTSQQMQVREDATSSGSWCLGCMRCYDCAGKILYFPCSVLRWLVCLALLAVTISLIVVISSGKSMEEYEEKMREFLETLPSNITDKFH